MNHTTILQDLINRFGYKSYLELGTFHKSLNYDKINCEKKLCVDVNPMAEPDFCGTTDEFFEYNTQTFDVVLVDALHVEEQVTKDILHSLACLKEGGTILVHDLLPTNEQMQAVPRTCLQWTGDCWKSWVNLRKKRKDLTMFVVDVDFGCGIIQKGSQPLLMTSKALVYDNFVKYRDFWMNVITEKEFEQWLKN